MNTRLIGFSLLFLLSSLSVSAEAPEGLETGPMEYFDLTDSPFSGPVEIIVDSNHPTASRGSFTDVFLLVRNHDNDGTVSVVIDLDLRYADGASVRPFHLGQDRVHTLGPDSGVGFFIFFAIAPDAPLGAATFEATARVARITGTDNNHANNDNPMRAVDSVTFEVVP